MVDHAYDEAALKAEVARHVEAALAQESLKPRERFCQLWPTAREGLAALNGIAPGTVRMLIGIVVAAGDAAASQTCGAPQG